MLELSPDDMGWVLTAILAAAFVGIVIWMGVRFSR
jgi:hypothetical protein